MSLKISQTVSKLREVFASFSKRFFLFFSFIAFSLIADETSRSLWDYHPIRVGGNLLRLGKADVNAPEGGHLYFRKSNAFLYLLLPISETSYFFPRFEWNTFTLDWDQNPKFRETHFYYFQFGLTFYTTSIEKWRWILRLDYNIDQEHLSRPGPYGLYTGLIWGSHQIHRKWHYHLGAMGYKGIGGQMVYPLIGFDFSPNKKWTFQTIFPIDYSIQYKVGKYWRFSLKGRPLRERFRTGGKETQPRSLFNYSSIGAEGNIHYEIEHRLELELFGGYNFGGSFYIKNREGHRSLYTTLRGAPYVGGNLTYGF